MEVKILGKIIRVNCPPGQEEALEEVAQELNDRLKQMSERTKVKDAQQLLAISALNAYYELRNVKAEKASQSHAIKERAQELQKLLDTALNKKDLSDDKTDNK